MKKGNILNLIKYHVEKNEVSFRNEAIEIANSFDNMGDFELAEYIMSLVAESNLYAPQAKDFESEYLNLINTDNLTSLEFPMTITEDIKGIINAVNHNVGLNKFLFQGSPGTGKTEASKHVARLLNRSLYYVNFDNLIDSKLGQTNKNIAAVFDEINSISHPEKIVILFDEIDVIALDRISNNDVREMGRVTSSILREFDRLNNANSEIVIIATTNLYDNFDKALIRRFDATINFDRYTQDDLKYIAEQLFNSYVKNFKYISKDVRLFRKIVNLSDALPMPGELNNLIKSSLAFSDTKEPYDYLKRLYTNLIIDITNVDIHYLHEQGFTFREIEKLTGESKSTVARKIKEGEN